MIYGYCRISRKEQSIERQIRNILAYEPAAKIFQEAYTGRKVYGRKEFNKLLNSVKEGDTIIFDSVSRMSRNAEEGVAIYFDLLNKGVELIFLKEMHINTSVYQQALQNGIDTTGNEIADIYIQATNKVLHLLAKEQIKIAFQQAEKEVQDLQQRTKEGIETARINGKLVGGSANKGKTLNVKKKEPLKQQIKALSKDFYGEHSDKWIVENIDISRNTFYKYKRELIEELKQENDAS